MSDEDRDVDIESDAEKRAHHNALERKRRDHIKDSFSSLRDSIPTLHGEKASRAQILKKAADYIHQMRKKNTVHQHDIDDLREQNELLETQVKALEKAKATGNLNGLPVLDTASFISCNSKGNTVSAFDGGSDSESSDSEVPPQTRRKKMKTNII